MEKLIIKLKIPQIPLNFNCPFCDKSFSCGKALGGHKRVHFLKTKSHYCRNINIPSNAEADQKKSCPVCDQKFLSEKSLHGHMRKHPDRNWRGMVPPTEQLQKPENNHDYPVHAPPQEDQEIKDYDSSDHQNIHDLTLPAWPKSGRRSRYGKAPMNNDEDDDDDDDDDQVTMSEVYDLMAIANVAANQKDSLSVPKKKKIELSLSQDKKSVVLENPGPGNEKTRNQSLGFEFNLNELPPEWTDDRMSS